jgi:hypothetical protein
MKFKLGKKPARPGAMKLKFADVFDATHLPVPPHSFGHQSLMANHQWGMLANDQVGDCVLAGGGHESMLFALEGGRPFISFSDKSTLSDYTAITGYNPNDPNSDQGTDMVEAAKYRRICGLLDANGVRHKIDAYAEITRGDLTQVTLATWLFGACGCGFAVPDSVQDQFDAGQPFDVVPGAQIEGGHYMPCIGRNSNGYYVLVTWGKTVTASPRFMKKYMDEAVAYISRDVIVAKTQKTQEGFDLAALDNFLAHL